MPPVLGQFQTWWKHRRPAYLRNWSLRGSFLWLRRHPLVIASMVMLVVLFGATFSFFYVKYSRMVTERLGNGSLRTSSGIYAAPRLLVPGDATGVSDLVAHLQRAGYSEGGESKVGRFRRTAKGLEISTGPESYFQEETVEVEFAGGKVKAIHSSDNSNAEKYLLEPEMITSVLDEARGKRRPAAYSEFPKHLIDAVVSVEDKRFFNHSGMDLLRMAKAAYVDLRERRKEQGASTLTMQLARSVWLDQDKTWGRKLAEMMIAAEMERRFTKQEIFELYGNEVYLGRRGSFAVHGFGEAARAYLNKDLRQLTVPESAMLAAMIQRPSYYNPFRFPDRVKQRRDLVLRLMHENGHLDAAQFASAVATPIELQPVEVESSDAPYFVDLVNEDLQNRFQDWDFSVSAYRIYTTLDLDLQRVAVESIQSAMAQVDKAAKRVGGKKVAGKTPQVALVALDPKTGAIKALVGGRDYDRSQLNRALAKRPPGSTFKPFVYAAGLNLGAQKRGEGITTATSVMDEPTQWVFNKQVYQPTNFGGDYVGPVTMRRALIQSMNIPTIKVAEKTGYQKVVALAKAAGITQPLQGTPSLALGSYEIPPLELAEAYTIFPNGGVHVRRNWIDSIRDVKNRPVYSGKVEKNQVLDERVAYIMTNMMEDVLRSGTGAGVRGRGFREPAAGKTGSARDGWFAGFTGNLLTVVWIGYDDYTELGLEGAKSALPVWAEFMKRAHQLRQYADPKPFKQPKGIIRVDIDTDTGFLAGENCLNVSSEVFVAGTEPGIACDGDHYVYDQGVLVGIRTPEKRRPFLGRVLDVFR